MKETFSAGMLLLAIIISGIVTIFGISYGSYQLYRYFAPKYANVQNKIYQNNASYNEGMIRDFENLKLEYLHEDDMNKKEAIHSVILHRFTVFGVDKLPPDLREFYRQMEEQP